MNEVPLPTTYGEETGRSVNCHCLTPVDEGVGIIKRFTARRGQVRYSRTFRLNLIVDCLRPGSQARCSIPKKKIIEGVRQCQALVRTSHIPIIASNADPGSFCDQTASKRDELDGHRHHFRKQTSLHRYRTEIMDQIK